MVRLFGETVDYRRRQYHT